jgi:hypothetical protein
MKIKVRVRRYEKFGRLAHRFRDAANGDLQRDAVNELQRASPPVLARVRAGVLAASFPAVPPSVHDWDTPKKHLRERLAAATHVGPLPQGNGIRFAVEYEQVDPQWGRRLAQLTDVEAASQGRGGPRWRHPLFGDREHWYMQRGTPWFFVNIRPARPEFEAGIHRAMQRTARKITGGR